MSSTIPSDISLLISKCSKKETIINRLESKLAQSKVEYNSAIITLQSKLYHSVEENNKKDTIINDLQQTIQFLEIDNQQHTLVSNHLQTQLSIKSLELENLKQELSGVKQTLKHTLERNNVYVQKCSDIEKQYLEQITKMNELSAEYKRKLKLFSKPKLN